MSSLRGIADPEPGFSEALELYRQLQGKKII